MFITVRPEIMSLAFQLLDYGPEGSIAVKISGEEKGSLDIFFFECFYNGFSAIGKSITCEYQRDFLFVSRPPNDRAVTIGQCFFFTSWLSFSFAANK